MNKSFWNVIGARRSRSFFIVLTVNAALVAALVLWFWPNEEQATNDLATAEQQKTQLQVQITELPTKFEEMQRNEASYEALRLRGFFADQDRIAVKQILSDLRMSSGVRQVAYDIKPQQTINNQALSNTDKQLLSSEVTVTLRGLTDMEMRGFVQALQETIPGVSTIMKQEFKRADALTDENLIKLGNGEPVDFVQSSYSFNWYTLYDKNDPYGMKAGGEGAAATPPGTTPPGVPVPEGVPQTAAPQAPLPARAAPADPAAPAASVPAAQAPAPASGAVPASPAGGQ